MPNLTCKQVNQKLAKRRGEYREVGDVAGIPPGWVWSPLNATGSWVCIYPDYCHDWRWAGVLFAELLHMAHSVYITFPPRVEESCFSGTAMTPGYTQELWHLAPIDPDEFPEAVARARWATYEEEGS